MWRHRGTFWTPYLFRFPNLVHFMFLPWIETVSLMFRPSNVENLLIHVWVCMGPSSSSYTLQVSFHNVEAQRYISDSLLMAGLDCLKFSQFINPTNELQVHSRVVVGVEHEEEVFSLNTL
ncbi:unnamed protein product [Microthlaspi erraticum]|uniref:Uncharacterized protein n=1 Tax=Microthlaspi erraticum TaxID=1685480 RepID=A0A6D2K9N0_9BRAS|nr:unnamed protein product [Microthlaspi erraticum]